MPEIYWRGRFSVRPQVKRSLIDLLAADYGVRDAAEYRNSGSGISAGL